MFFEYTLDYNVCLEAGRHVHSIVGILVRAVAYFNNGAQIIVVIDKFFIEVDVND